MFNRSLRIVGTLVAALALASCGQKGPLVVPGVPAGATWPYPQPVKPSEPAPKKTPDVPARGEIVPENK